MPVLIANCWPLIANFVPLLLTSNLVEHPCYQCQASVEEGVPFCPHCGAPQIRVLPPDAAASDNSPNAGAIPPPRIETPGSVWTQGRPTYSVPSTPIRWNVAWRGALLAGVVAGMLSDLPYLSYFFFLWLTGAGVAAVSMYSRRVPGTFLTGGMGLRIGALTGLFAFLLNAIGTTIVFTFAGDTVRKMLQEQLQSSMAKAPDPKAQQMLQDLVARLSTPDGMATFFVVLLLVLAVLFVVLAAAGGAVGASMARRRAGLG